MKITNITKGAEITLYLLDVDGSEVSATIKVGQFVFTPNNEKTKTINLHGAKKNIGVSAMSPKPDFLEFFIPYSDSDLPRLEEEYKIKLKLEEEASRVVEESSYEHDLKGEIRIPVNKEFKEMFKEYCSSNQFDVSKRIRFLMDKDMLTNKKDQ